MADIDLQDIHDTLISIAYKAGEMITSAHPSTAGTDLKKNSADLVTETDRAVEDLVSSTLRQKYPSYKFMGEETYKPGDKLTDDPTFVVDPIDGTTNFVHKYPYVSISLGFAIRQIPSVGIVFNPFTQVLYSAIKGHGAYRTSPNLIPLSAFTASSSSSQTPQPQPPQRVKLPLGRTEELTELNKALLAIEWGSDRSGQDFAIKSRVFNKLCLDSAEGGAMVHGLRSFGSAALNLCAVAEGGIDVYWESGCWAWDVCAGWVVLEEAGGRVCDGNPVDGGPQAWTPRVDERRYLACRRGVRDSVVREFWGVMEGEGRLSYGP